MKTGKAKSTLKIHWKISVTITDLYVFSFSRMTAVLALANIYCTVLYYGFALRSTNKLQIEFPHKANKVSDLLRLFFHPPFFPFFACVVLKAFDEHDGKYETNSQYFHEYNYESVWSTLLLWLYACTWSMMKSFLFGISSNAFWLFPLSKWTTFC